MEITCFPPIQIAPSCPSARNVPRRSRARDYDPSRINKYVTELAARFHRFYTACRIKGAEEGVLNARLCLADTVRKVIALSLSVIGVSAPSKM